MVKGLMLAAVQLLTGVIFVLGILTAVDIFHGLPPSLTRACK